MNAIEITKDNFEDTVKKNDIVILDFWASWCGPCKMFAPVFEKVAQKHPDVAFGKINTEVEYELSEKFQVRSIPTIMAFREGILIFSQAGALPEHSLEELIKEIKKLDMEDVRRKMELRTIK